MVAEAAKVSSATVSRVYNNPESVSPDKRSAVLSCAAALGYVPNKSASALRRSGTGIITLVEFDKGERPYYWNDMPAFNWFYADIIKGVKSALDHTMYLLNLQSLESPEGLSELEQRSDGLIFFDIDDEQEASAARSVRIPYVAAHHTKAFRELVSCSTDNTAGGRLQAGELQRRGSKRPLYVVSYLDSVMPHAERLRGFLSLFPRGAEVLQLDRTDTAAEDLFKALQYCDGVACVNDLLLMQVLSLLADRRDLISRLPVVGYDGSPLKDYAPVPFASVSIHQKEIYHKAARMLLSMLSSGERQHTAHEVIPPTLVPAETKAWHSLQPPV